MSKKKAAKKEAKSVKAATEAKGPKEPKPVKVAPEPKARKKPERDDGTMSGLAAAAKVLADAKEPLRCNTIVERALATGLWKTNGKTPAATVYAAILRDIAKKGAESRFKKASRGMFTIKA